MEFGAELSGRNFRLCTVRRGAAASPIFVWGHPAASPRVAAAAVTRRVQRYTNADMPAILGRGVESSSASSFRRARDLIEITLAGAPIFLHWYGSQQLSEAGAFVPHSRAIPSEF